MQPNWREALSGRGYQARSPRIASDRSALEAAHCDSAGISPLSDLAARGLTACSIAILARRDVVAFFERNPGAWPKLVEVLCDRLRRTDQHLAEMALLKQSRLSVQPVTAAEWKLICAMGGLKRV